MAQPASDDRKPSGAPYRPEFNLAHEVHLAFSKMIACVYHGLGPVNILLVAAAWLLLSLIADLGTSGGGLQPVPPTLTGPLGDLLPNVPPSIPQEWGRHFRSPVSLAGQYIEPWMKWLQASGRDFWLQGFCALLTLVVWSWVATFICRSTAVQLNGIPHQWGGTTRFTTQHYWDALLSILIPVLAVAVLAIPAVMIGLLLTNDWLSLLGGPLTMVAFLLALPAGLLLLGVVLGWPLMFPAIAIEGRDSFESISRTFAYVLQRPVQAVLLAVMAALIGTVINLFLAFFFTLAEGVYLGAINWGANAFTSERYAHLVAAPSKETSGIVLYWTRPLLSSTHQGFSTLAIASQHVVFWGLVTAVYLLLRRSLDQTSLDEIYRPGQGTLAPLSVDKIPAATSNA